MEDIWLYGAAEWSPEQAARYIDWIVAVFDLLCAMPESSPKSAPSFRPLFGADPSVRPSPHRLPH